MKHTDPLAAMKADAAACNARMRHIIGIGVQSYQRQKPPAAASSMQDRILAAATDRPMTASQLAKRARVTVAAARKAVQRLEKRGQLVRDVAVFTPSSGGMAKTYRRAKP